MRAPSRLQRLPSEMRERLAELCSDPTSLITKLEEHLEFCRFRDALTEVYVACRIRKQDQAELAEILSSLPRKH